MDTMGQHAAVGVTYLAADCVTVETDADCEYAPDNLRVVVVTVGTLRSTATSLILDPLTAAHEIGHTLGLPHSLLDHMGETPDEYVDDHRNSPISIIEIHSYWNCSSLWGLPVMMGVAPFRSYKDAAVDEFLCVSTDLTYVDINCRHWAWGYIERLAERITPISGDYYHPDWALSRSRVANWLVQSALTIRAA